MIVLVLPDIPAEDALLARARRVDDDALREIYTHYYTPIYQFIRLRTEDRDTAEDLAAEVFFKLVRAVHERKAPRHSLRGWLFRVARHVLYDHYGHQQHFTEEALSEWIPMPVQEDPELQAIRAMNREITQQALRQLTVEQQEVLILRFGQMLGLQETADIMDKKVNAVKQLQLRALQALRRALGQLTMEIAHD